MTSSALRRRRGEGEHVYAVGHLSSASSYAPPAQVSRVERGRPPVSASPPLDLIARSCWVGMETLGAHEEAACPSGTSWNAVIRGSCQLIGDERRVDSGVPAFRLVVLLVPTSIAPQCALEVLPLGPDLPAALVNRPSDSERPAL